MGVGRNAGSVAGTIRCVNDPSSRPLCVLHLVSGQPDAGPQTGHPLLPLLTRNDRQRLQLNVAQFSPGNYGAVLRQAGVPVHDLALSRKKFALGAIRDCVDLVRRLRPDVVHAWGSTAQCASALLLRWMQPAPRLVWTIVATDSLSANADRVTRMKVQAMRKLSPAVDVVVYTSEVAAARHERLGFAGRLERVIAPGLDVERYKPDFNARQRIREQLQLSANALVVGMQAPFQTQFDHATLLKAGTDLIRAHPHTQILLAGRGVQRGNAPLMALVGGSTLASRVHLLGEWSDTAALFNACDVVCSTALHDESRMTLAMAMLCGVPCVATGIGAQGEVLGTVGVSVEPGSATSLTRGLIRIAEMPPERRAFLARGARQHALAKFDLRTNMAAYHSLYADLSTQITAVRAHNDPVATPQPDASVATSRQPN